MTRRVQPAGFASMAARDRAILRLRGKKSFSLIAARFGVSRDVVAGVMWRATWPKEQRVHSRGDCQGGRNKIGVGHHGPGHYARVTRCTEGAPQ